MTREGRQSENAVKAEGGDFLRRGKCYPTLTEWSVTLPQGEKAIAYSPATRRVWGLGQSPKRGQGEYPLHMTLRSKV